MYQDRTGTYFEVHQKHNQVRLKRGWRSREFFSALFLLYHFEPIRKRITTLPHTVFFTGRNGTPFLKKERFLYPYCFNESRISRPSLLNKLCNSIYVNKFFSALPSYRVAIFNRTIKNRRVRTGRFAYLVLRNKGYAITLDMKYCPIAFFFCQNRDHHYLPF